MALQYVVHPRQIIIDGVKFQVMTPEMINDEQASYIASLYYRRKRRWSKKDRKQTHAAIFSASAQQIDGFLEAGREAAEELKRLLS